jgi:hypothetical protein
MDHPRVAQCNTSVRLCMRSSINLSKSLGGTHGCWTMSRWYNNKPSIIDLECVWRLVALLCILEAAVESLGVNSRFELPLSELSRAFCTACRHMFVIRCSQSLKTCLYHGLSVVGVSCSVTRVLSYTDAIRPCAVESNSALSVSLFYRSNSKVWLRSVAKSAFANIGSMFSGRMLVLG